MLNKRRRAMPTYNKMSFLGLVLKILTESDRTLGKLKE
jgi:hypothetical protein